MTETVTCIKHFTNDKTILKHSRELAWQVALGLGKYNQGALHLGVYAKSPYIKNVYDELYAVYDRLTLKLSNEDLLRSIQELKLIVPITNAGRGRLIGGMIALDVIAIRPGIDFYSSHNDSLDLPVRLNQDRYNLVDVDERFQLENQGIIFENTLIFYHPFLRRFFSARFVDTPAILRRLQGNDEVKLKIALDPIRHGVPSMLDRTLEFDHWYGMQFDAGKLNDREFRGVTVHGRHDQTGVLDLTFPLIKTTFYVSDYANNEKEFQIEEIVPTESQQSAGQKYVLHRFAHFIWNTEDQTFRHFDCSVLIYTKGEHAKRVKYDWKQLDNKHYAKVYKRKKLFRLDGSIELEIIKDLLFSFFRYNELVMEYFGAYPEGVN
jgi:hypothetical protein